MTRARITLAWILLVGGLIGWPVTQFTVAADEPPFVLALSWLAIILTAVDILSTQDVRHQQDNDHNDGPDR